MAPAGLYQLGYTQLGYLHNQVRLRLHGEEIPVADFSLFQTVITNRETPELEKPQKDLGGGLTLRMHYVVL